MRILAAGGGLQGVVHFRASQHALRARRIVAIAKSAATVGFNHQIIFTQTKALTRRRLILHVELERCVLRRRLQQRLRFLRLGSSHDRYRRCLRRLVAKSDAQA
jgi:hypothetical protein